MPRRPVAPLDRLRRTRARPRRFVIYVDSSVVLAQLLAEDRFPDPAFWQDGPFVSSRLLEYEVWNRINGRGLGPSHADDARLLVGRLASIEFLRSLGQRPVLATYDRRLAEAATSLDISISSL